MTHLSAVNQFSHDEFLFEDDSAVRPRCPGRLVIMRGARPRMITNCVFSVAPSLGTHGARITEIRGSNPLSSNGPGFPTPTIRQQFSALARKPMNANSDKSLEYLSWLTSYWPDRSRSAASRFSRSLSNSRESGPTRLSDQFQVGSWEHDDDAVDNSRPPSLSANRHALEAPSTWRRASRGLDNRERGELEPK